MGELKWRSRLRPSVAAIGALAMILVAFGAAITTSQEEESDPCTGYDDAAYAYCNAYCETLDCDENPASEEKCLYTFDRFADYTGEAPPCETPES